MSIFQYYRINRKLFGKEKRPSAPYVFLGLGIILLLMSYRFGAGTEKRLLKEYCADPLSGVILAVPEDGTAINGASVSRLAETEGVRTAVGVYEFPMEIRCGMSSVSVSVWAVERKIIGDMNLRYTSLSEEAMSSQLPVIMSEESAKRLGSTVSAGDRIEISIAGSAGISSRIAATTDNEGAGVHLSDELRGKVFAGMEDVSSVMNLLFEHEAWPGQESSFGGADIGDMKYCCVMAFAEESEDILEVTRRLENTGYTCITGFEEFAQAVDDSRSSSMGFLLSGISFMMCAIYMLCQMMTRRLESSADKASELRDLGWNGFDTKALVLMDHGMRIAATAAVSFLAYLVAGALM